MELFLECLMVSAFCAALLLALMHFARHNDAVSKADRLLTLTMLLGFLLGITEKLLQGHTDWLLFFYILGAMLSYMAFLFSLPDWLAKKL